MRNEDSLIQQLFWGKQKQKSNINTACNFHSVMNELGTKTIPGDHRSVCEEFTGSAKHF